MIFDFDIVCYLKELEDFCCYIDVIFYEYLFCYLCIYLNELFVYL